MWDTKLFEGECRGGRCYLSFTSIVVVVTGNIYFKWIKVSWGFFFVLTKWFDSYSWSGCCATFVRRLNLLSLAVRYCQMLLWTPRSFFLNAQCFFTQALWLSYWLAPAGSLIDVAISNVSKQHVSMTISKQRLHLKELWIIIIAQHVYKFTLA